MPKDRRTRSQQRKSHWKYEPTKYYIVAFALTGILPYRKPAFDIQVKNGNTPPTRPHVSRSACPAALFEMMELCWNQIPLERPSFVKIRDQYLKKVLGNTKENIVDQLLKRMDQYSNTLEKKVATANCDGSPPGGATLTNIHTRDFLGGRENAATAGRKEKNR